MQDKYLILLVDDDTINLKKAQDILIEDSYRVAVAKSGKQALQFLERNVPDLALLDINMPEMNGFELMEAIHKIPELRELPIIFLTSDNTTETETKCLEMGAIDFISKPFVPTVMCSRIARVLEVEALRKSLANRLDQKIKEVSDMKSKASQDPLTGLWNRSYTEGEVNRLIKSGAQGTLFMIDMDNFKLINDHYGHLAGDQVLQIFADTMKKYAKDGDILCRIGGDEFITFIKDDIAKAKISNHAADIIADICFKIGECKYDTNTSVSIGISQCPEDGTDFNTLYNAADKALYHVKQNGKNSFHFYSDQSAVESTRNAKNVDLQYLREMMRRSDGGKGSYLMDYENFHYIYNFIRRIVERSNREVQTLLFTLEGMGAEENQEELALANEMLEQAIYLSLRRVDVSTRYSSHQMVVILMDANMENGKRVAQRIVDCFQKLYIGDIRIDYSIVQMDEKL